jgi:hypothetical protein
LRPAFFAATIPIISEIAKKAVMIPQSVEFKTIYLLLAGEFTGIFYFLKMPRQIGAQTDLRKYQRFNKHPVLLNRAMILFR